ncbi:hypothetical protein [Streptosporangium sp. 'caverna']|uniref:hypothetical protein n=1 Tax=Streptosporangium sp. 'caverna' TaxID=2202249 RepID=UPI000D7DCF17|nr:hypothetical protein [Streptosporangium sp. 'caverna']AWS42959.1 hypothetical protein DKM19_17880 [Streptosporangium sp. 'caverna']
MPYRFPQLLHEEWTRFRTARGWVLTMAASVLVTVSLGLLIAGGARSVCDTSEGAGPCPAPLLGPDGTAVSDKYYFVHQPLKGNGSITARVSDMTGQMRQPDAVPGVRNVKEGVVPWAKAGLLVRQSLTQGTPYAAVMITGSHGVRMQRNFTHDVAGGPVQGPLWLRLTRLGDTLTGYESSDGKTWIEVSTVELTGLPETVEIGLFTTSPGALWEMAEAFAQATATFDQITLQGANGSWRRDDVGVKMEEDGKTPHHPGGVVESGDKLLITGGGDIGPATVDGGLRADLMLIGGGAGLIPVLVVAVTFFTADHRRGLTRTDLAAKAVVIGAVAFVTGLVTSAVVVPVGLAMLRANQNPIQPITLGTELRVIVGYAALTAAAAVLALGLAVLVRRGIVAIGLAIALVVVPYLLATAGLVPWLLMITPAAGFAITQSVPTFAHVDVVLSLLGGYYPLPPWAGLTVTCGYAALVLGVAIAVHRRKVPR